MKSGEIHVDSALDTLILQNYDPAQPHGLAANSNEFDQAARMDSAVFASLPISVASPVSHF